MADRADEKAALTVEQRDAVMQPWCTAAKSEGWDVTADTIYWGAVDGLAWALIEETMDTADHGTSSALLAEARATAERILARRSLPDSDGGGR